MARKPEEEENITPANPAEDQSTAPPDGKTPPTPGMSPDAPAVEDIAPAQASPKEATSGKKEKRKPKINFSSLDYRIAVMEEYTNLWQKFFSFFGEGFEGRRIREQEEKEFHEVIVALAKKHYRHCETIGDLLDKSKKSKLLDIICETVSLSHIKSTAVSEFNSLMFDWHDVFIAMNRGLGKLLGKKQSLEEKRLTKQELRSGGKKKKAAA